MVYFVGFVNCYFLLFQPPVLLYGPIVIVSERDKLQSITDPLCFPVRDNNGGQSVTYRNHRMTGQPRNLSVQI